jgi:hypothetical protein
MSSVFSTMLRQVKIKLRPPYPRQGKLTHDSASAHEIIAIRGHVGYSRRALALLCLHLFPGYDRVPRRGGDSVWIPLRTIYFCLSEVALQRTNPFVTPISWAFPQGPSAKTSPWTIPRQKTLPFKPPCCQLLLYIMSALSIIFPCSGISFATSLY